MKIARGYCRVSTEVQLSGVSLEVQRKKIEEFCQSRKLTLVKIYVDEGISGKDMDRPAIKLLLSEVSSGETLVTNDLSRVSRNLDDSVALLDFLKMKGVNLESIEEQFNSSIPEARSLFEEKVKLAQIEREQVSKKVSESMNYLSEQGKLRSRPPFGWKFAGKGKSFEKCPEQQAVIGLIKEMHIRGENLSRIAKSLNESGLSHTLTLNKKEKGTYQIFYPRTIKRILVDSGIIEGTVSTARTPLASRLAVGSDHSSVEEASETSNHARVIMVPAPPKSIFEELASQEPILEKLVSDSEKPPELIVYRSSQEKKSQVENFIRGQQAKILHQQQEIRTMFEAMMQRQLAQLEKFGKYEAELNNYYAQLERLADSM